jgi:L-seryl-tRNA(Ser) seleniumtransferase
MSQLRHIPSIDQLRQRPAIRALEAQFGHDATLGALRAGAAAVRDAMADGSAEIAGELVASRIEAIAQSRLSEQFAPSLVPVINATGVVLHTNLGRAPLADAAVERMALVAARYATLEYDAATGRRGRRDVHGETLLRALTGADAAVVANNNAAATMLLLAALAAGREVIVSRGELVEIGGGFRVPDVMAQSGAVLREVGTTNKTRAADYAAAITDRTALILRVHPSNFRLDGFVERPDAAALAAIARQFQVPLAEDLGSGFLAGSRRVRPPTGDRAEPARDEVPAAAPSGAHPLEGKEPSVEDSLAAGVHICCFSGDKLLGGPQAGIIVGRRDLVERVRRHPLMRALRVDKITYAALEATLIEYAAGRADRTVPVQRMLRLPAAAIKERAEALATAIRAKTGWDVEVVPGHSAVGGGSAPGVELPTWLVAIEREGTSPDALEALLRGATPPVIARIEKDRVLLDLRTVFPAQDAPLTALFRSLD